MLTENVTQKRQTWFSCSDVTKKRHAVGVLYLDSAMTDGEGGTDVRPQLWLTKGLFCPSLANSRAGFHGNIRETLPQLAELLYLIHSQYRQSVYGQYFNDAIAGIGGHHRPGTHAKYASNKCLIVGVPNSKSQGRSPRSLPVIITVLLLLLLLHHRLLLLDFFLRTTRGLAGGARDDVIAGVTICSTLPLVLFRMRHRL